MLYPSPGKMGQVWVTDPIYLKMSAGKLPCSLGTHPPSVGLSWNLDGKNLEGSCRSEAISWPSSCSEPQFPQQPPEPRARMRLY